MEQPLVPLGEAVTIAAATTDGTVILTDAADATELGCVGRRQRDPARAGRGRLPRHGARADRRRAGGRGGVRGRAGRHGPDDDRRPARSGALPPAAVRGRGSRCSATAASRASRTACQCNAGPTAVLRERHGDDRRHQPAGDAPRPVALPGAWARTRRRSTRSWSSRRTASHTCSMTGRRGSSTSTRPARRAPTCAAWATPAARGRSSRSTTTSRSSPASSSTRGPATGCSHRCRGGARMRIREIRAVGLFGATPGRRLEQRAPAGGLVHTLVAVRDRRRASVGFGGVFTNAGLVRAALDVARAALSRREPRIEPERVSEKLHQNTFWLGRGGSHHPRDQRRSTSRSGTSSARPPDSRSAGCSAAATASASGPTPRS